MSDKNDFFKVMENDVANADIDETTKKKLFENIFKLKNQKVNLMITGATGCGKSSTINALFSTEVAKVGVGVDPETMDIKKYDLENLILWDTPGLGDGKEKDIKHSKAIIKKLNETDKKGDLLIDLVLVLLDGSTRDLGTSYELINQVIIPNLGENPENRMLVAINQADVAMKGRYWNHENNKPEKKLKDFLEEKVISVKKRIREATGVSIKPIYFSAGYKEEGEEQRPYNLSKLLYFIVQHTPRKKRLAYVGKTSNDKEMWQDNDEIKDYNTEIKKSFMETVKEYGASGADIGGEIGSIFGGAGKAVGKLVGGAVGAIFGGMASIFGF